MEDNRLETFEQCSEFEHINPESLINVDSDTFDQSFKSIDRISLGWLAFGRVTFGLSGVLLILLHVTHALLRGSA